MSPDIRPDRRIFLQQALAGALAIVGALGAVGRALAEAAPDAAGRLAAGVPSSTAMSTAVSRALHQVIDHPRILDDPLALAIIGSDGARELQAAADRGSRGSRAFIALRSRYAEDRVAAAVARGVQQYVVLGAGLDTYAYRNAHAARGLHVFEVDHPATQRWKRARLTAARIAVPSSTTFVPVDFETQTLAGELARGGFRADRPAFFSMLGVVVYLTEDALMDTLRFVASCAPGSEIAFSFPVSDAHLDERALARRERSRARMATIGESWRTFLDPAALDARLRAVGYGGVEIVTPARANEAYFAGRIDGLKVGGGACMAAAWV